MGFLFPMTTKPAGGGRVKTRALLHSQQRHSLPAVSPAPAPCRPPHLRHPLFPELDRPLPLFPEQDRPLPLFPELHPSLPPPIPSLFLPPANSPGSLAATLILCVLCINSVKIMCPI